ncbi:hypothetical protein, conserved [Eimeria brunetti]|uniref:Uncharacterized protein n=1 Tax=Eimeria brunetti TaxID=51314 RepID=U6LDT4_9EIME|nr:hypothetical protein, conserved [Eimeria brunetti]
MLQHSASAVYLPRRPRDSSLGPRTFSSTSIGGDPTCKTVHGVPLQTSLTASTSGRMGLSDEETCSRSDSSSSRTALMHRASSFLASRRGSSEAFEDALETLDPPQTAADLSNDYSSYAFTVKAPASDVPGSQAGGAPTRASPRGTQEEESIKVEAPLSNRETEKPATGSNKTSISSGGGRSAATGGGCEMVGEGGSAGDAHGSHRSHISHASEQGSSSKQHKKGHRKQQEEPFPTAPVVSDSMRSSRDLASASEREEGGFPAFSGPHKNPSAATDKREETEETSFPRATSQETRRMHVPRRAIGRYSSVPAFSASDRVRIDRFKEGLPECLSTQEAIKKQRRATAQEGCMHRRDAGTPFGIGPSGLSCTNELGEAVDWRSLLDAAGLGEMRDEEITLEAEELHAKLQEFAPRSGPGWCFTLLSCLWQWRM